MLSITVRNCRRTNPLVIAVGGASNVFGHETGTPWHTKPSNVTYWTTKTGSLVNTADWPNNPGIAMCMIDTIVNTYGYTDPITLVEHGVSGSAYQTWASTYAAQLITHCNTAGVIPSVVVLYMGLVDAGSHALAVAVRDNCQTAMERFRTKWGGAVGLVGCGVHTPEAGSTADLDLVDAGVSDFVADHGSDLAAYFNNRDAPIAGGGSDHLSGGPTGGCQLTGERVALQLFLGGLI